MCGQTGCKAIAKWDVYRKVNDSMLIFGTYCERHALMTTTEPGIYFRPVPSLADVAATRERERAVRYAR